MTIKTTISRAVTKASNLLTSAIELPNALHACVEMAREAESSRAIVTEHDGTQICGKLSARIAELEKELSLAKDENRALDLRQKIANEELDRFIAWASPLAQSLPGTVCGDYVSDTIRDHIESITRELAALKCSHSDLAERYSQAAEMAAASERELNREREARRRRKQSEEPAPHSTVVVEYTASGLAYLMPGRRVYPSSEWRYLSPEDMPND